MGDAVIVDEMPTVGLSISHSHKSLSSGYSTPPAVSLAARPPFGHCDTPPRTRSRFSCRHKTHSHSLFPLPLLLPLHSISLSLHLPPLSRSSIALSTTISTTTTTNYYHGHYLPRPLHCLGRSAYNSRRRPLLPPTILPSSPPAWSPSPRRSSRDCIIDDNYSSRIEYHESSIYKI
jgi:hypothetical protein